MTPEQTLLLLGASPNPTQEQIEKIRQQLSMPLNWSEIVAQANRHGISQLLFHTIQQIEGAALPEAVHSTLRGRFDRAIRRNLLLTGELLRIINLLGERGITAVPFKGPVLAEKLYNNLALRVFGDLDILIEPETAETAKSLMLADGYQFHYHPDSAHQFVKANSQIVVEVHWEAISFGSDWLRKIKSKALPTTLSHLGPRLQETKLGGKAISTLSPEDTLLILTIHGSKHWWSRINWLADIAALIDVYPNLDWAWVIDQTDRWEIRRLVFLGLYMVQELLSADLPAIIQQQLTAEPALEKLSNLAQSMFFVEQNFQTRYIKRPTYFRQLWDTKAERRMLYLDHLALYWELFMNLFR